MIRLEMKNCNMILIEKQNISIIIWKTHKYEYLTCEKYDLLIKDK